MAFLLFVTGQYRVSEVTEQHGGFNPKPFKISILLTSYNSFDFFIPFNFRITPVYFRITSCYYRSHNQLKQMRTIVKVLAKVASLCHALE
jgi:hypothetical protein